MVENRSEQASACAINNVIPLFSALNKVEHKAELKPKRCRPKKLGDPTPATESFDSYAAQIARIPKDRRKGEPDLPAGVRGWHEAKLYAHAAIRKDRRLSSAARSVGGFLIDHINHVEGRDWHTVAQIAAACSLAEGTVSDGIARLRLTGHIARRSRRTARGDWWDTTIPTLARSAIAEKTATQSSEGISQSTVGCPSIDGEVPAGQLGRGSRQSTAQTFSSIKPFLETLKQPPPPKPAEGGGIRRCESEEKAPQRRLPSAAPYVRAPRQNFGNHVGKVGERNVQGPDAEDILAAAKRLEPTARPDHVRWAVRIADEKLAAKTTPYMTKIVEFCIEETRRQAVCERLGIDPADRYRNRPPENWWQNAAAVARMLEDDWERIIEQAGNRWSLSLLGPAPGEEDCLVPQALIDRHPSCKAHIPEKYWWRGWDQERRKDITDEFWTGFVRRFAKKTWLVEFLGPLPGDPGCIVPHHIIRREHLERFGPQGGGS